MIFKLVAAINSVFELERRLRFGATMTQMNGVRDKQGMETLDGYQPIMLNQSTAWKNTPGIMDRYLVMPLSISSVVELMVVFLFVKVKVAQGSYQSHCDLIRVCIITELTMLLMDKCMFQRKTDLPRLQS